MKQREFEERNGGLTQCEAILRRLQADAGRWVSMPDLWRASGAFAVHSRIADLRRRGLTVLHKNERAPDGTIHSYYLLRIEPTT